jgi:TRAP-type C4-dicarboxylate transport system permease small subunit
VGIYLLQVVLRLTWGRRQDPEKRERRIALAESTVLSVILFSMIFFAALQIVLRNFFHTGLVWIDPLLRYLVLWIGLLGAFAATRTLRHITIDVLGRMFPEGIKPAVRALTSAVAVVTCALLANASWGYLRGEVILGARVFLGIPSWVAVSILVFGFAGMGWRFLEWVLWPRTGGPGRPPKEDEFAATEEQSPEVAAPGEAPRTEGETP